MRPALRDGFAYWRHEAETNKAGYAEGVPYLSVIPLVGIYTVLCAASTEEPTSYSWRQYILSDQNALAGLRHGLGKFASDLDDDESIPIDTSDEYVSGQANRIDESIHDGLPADSLTMPWNEAFLAKHLGLAVHDDAIRLSPLRLLEQGWYAMHSHHPATADYLEEFK